MRRGRAPLPAFAAGWMPQQVAAGARLVLSLKGSEAAFERQVDRLCSGWNALPCSTAYLDATAPFLENVSVLENLWVPLVWRHRISLAEIVRRSQVHLPALGWTARDLQHLLACRPGDLPPAVTARTVLLRAALARPDWVLIEPGWFERPLLAAGQVLPLMQALLGDSRWLLLWSPERGALPLGVPWHTIQLEGDA